MASVSAYTNEGGYSSHRRQNGEGNPWEFSTPADVEVGRPSYTRVDWYIDRLRPICGNFSSISSNASEPLERFPELTPVRPKSRYFAEASVQPPSTS